MLFTAVLIAVLPLLISVEMCDASNPASNNFAEAFPLFNIIDNWLLAVVPVAPLFNIFSAFAWLVAPTFTMLLANAMSFADLPLINISLIVASAKRVCAKLVNVLAGIPVLAKSTKSGAV